MRRCTSRSKRRNFYGSGPSADLRPPIGKAAREKSLVYDDKSPDIFGTEDGVSSRLLRRRLGGFNQMSETEDL